MSKSIQNTINWPASPSKWSDELLALLAAAQNCPRSNADNVNVEELIGTSDQFTIPFPIETARCKHLKANVPAETLERNINSVYPLITERTLHLYVRFLLYKRQHGSAIEKKLYRTMSLMEFIDRLLKQRAVMFMGRFDRYILLNGSKGAGKWHIIGTDKENAQLNLKTCLSYDEIKLSALLAASSYTYFVNNGTRKNLGKENVDRDAVQNDGVIIGLIGARLRKVQAMEYEEIVVSQEQNTEQNGFGTGPSMHTIMADLYDEPSLTYDQLLLNIKEGNQTHKNRFTEISKGVYFDNVVFAKRITIPIDILLMEANARAKECRKSAYIHIVGIGLGVWKISPHQEQIFADTFYERVTTLAPLLNDVSDLHFSYFGVKTVGNVPNDRQIPIADHPQKGIKVYISKRDPHTKLTGPHADKLLVISYAWDGNSLPGNEYWEGKLGSTSDSAAASSTQITEIHNPHINKQLCAANLKIVTAAGLTSLDDYKLTIVKRKKRPSYTTSTTDDGPSHRHK